MLLEVATLPKPDKIFKDFCNNLRCPLCNSQLDGNVHPKEAKLYCIANNDEYKCNWYPDDIEPRVEIIKFWYPEYEYVIGSVLAISGTYHTFVSRYNRDVANIYRESTRKELFSYDGPRLLVFRQRMDEEQFLKKLKTIKVFS